LRRETRLSAASAPEIFWVAVENRPQGLSRTNRRAIHNFYGDQNTGAVYFPVRFFWPRLVSNLTKPASGPNIRSDPDADNRRRLSVS
jgi:hypothetical protein